MPAPTPAPPTPAPPTPARPASPPAIGSSTRKIALRILLGLAGPGVIALLALVLFDVLPIAQWADALRPGDAMRVEVSESWCDLGARIVATAVAVAPRQVGSAHARCDDGSLGLVGPPPAAGVEWLQLTLISQRFEDIEIMRIARSQDQVKACVDGLAVRRPHPEHGCSIRGTDRQPSTGGDSRRCESGIRGVCVGRCN